MLKKIDLANLFLKSEKKNKNIQTQGDNKTSTRFFLKTHRELRKVATEKSM